MNEPTEEQQQQLNVLLDGLQQVIEENMSYVIRGYQDSLSLIRDARSSRYDSDRLESVIDELPSLNTQLYYDLNTVCSTFGSVRDIISA